MSTVQPDTPPSVPPPTGGGGLVRWRNLIMGVSVAGLLAAGTQGLDLYSKAKTTFFAADETQSMVTTIDERVKGLEKDKETRAAEVSGLARDVQEIAKDLVETRGQLDKSRDLERDLSSKVDRLVGLVEGLAGRAKR